VHALISDWKSSIRPAYQQPTVFYVLVDHFIAELGDHGHDAGDIVLADSFPAASDITQLPRLPLPLDAVTNTSREPAEGS